LKTVVFVGGGHAHLHCIRHARKLLSSNVILISPDRYQYYSGMFSSYTEGIYSEEEIKIDLQDLCNRTNVTFLMGKVHKVDSNTKEILLSNGKRLSYDILSFDIGSIIPTLPNSLSIKPNYLFPSSIHKLRSTKLPVIIGGGASGVELALSLAVWRKNNGYPNSVTIISKSKLLANMNPKARQKLRHYLKDLVVMEDEEVEKVGNTTITTNAGRTIPYTSLLAVTGNSAPPIFEESSLPTKDGFLHVRETLQCVDNPHILGAGDCIHFSMNGLPKNGVFAVKQGPILLQNITRLLNNKPLIAYRPQKRYLSILSVGNRQALLVYHSLVLKGRIPWLLKHYIDQSFMKNYQNN